MLPLKDANISPRHATNGAITPISIFRLASPALFSLQQTPVGGDLSLQFHLGIQQLVVALALGGQSHPHLLQLSLQAADHLGEVLQTAGVQLLRVLQGGLQAFLLNSESHSTVALKLKWSLYIILECFISQGWENILGFRSRWPGDAAN